MPDDDDDDECFAVDSDYYYDRCILFVRQNAKDYFAYNGGR